MNTKRIFSAIVLFLAVTFLSIQTPAQQPQTAEQMFEAGLQKHNAGQFPEAISTTTACIQQYPAFHGCYLLRAFAYQGQREFQKSVADFGKAILLKPDEYQAFFGRSGSLRELGRYSEALSDLDKAIGLKPDSYLAFAFRGYTHELACLAKRDNGKVCRGKSIQDLEKAVALNPQDPQVHLTLENIYFETGDAQASLDALNRGIAANPNSPELYVRRTHRHGEAGRTDRAAADVRSVRKFAPASPMLEEAEECLLKHLRDDVFRGRTLEEASANCAKAIQAMPDLSAGYRCRGQSYFSLYLKRKDTDYARMALVDFKKALSVGGESVNSHYWVAGVSLELKDFNQAISSTSRALEMLASTSPGKIKTDSEYQNLELRFKAYEQAGNFSAARKDVSRLIAIDITSWNNWKYGQESPFRGSPADLYLKKIEFSLKLGNLDTAARDGWEYLKFYRGYMNLNGERSYSIPVRVLDDLRSAIRLGVGNDQSRRSALSRWINLVIENAKTDPNVNSKDLNEYSKIAWGL